MIKPYYDDGKGIVIYNCDCRDILPELTKVDLVLTDPPYGLGKKLHDGGTWSTNPIYDAMLKWDLKPVDINLLNDIIAKADSSIIWGGNYYQLPISRCWFAWIKTYLPTLADFELAWTSKDKNSRKFEETRNPDGKREHPTQKPLELMRWCIQQADYWNIPQTILDPFMGSGTTLRAAKDLGRKCIGIEIEEKYCEIATKRLQQEVFDFKDKIESIDDKTPKLI